MVGKSKSKTALNKSLVRFRAPKCYNVHFDVKMNIIVQTAYLGGFLNVFMLKEIIMNNNCFDNKIKKNFSSLFILRV